MSNVYLHGFSDLEQTRLLRQAKMLEEYVFEKVDFSKTKEILEIGSGVGAQTSILRKKFPRLKITCIDLSEEQIKVAKKRLKKDVASKKVEILHLNAIDMERLNKQFDGAVMTWFLEHVKEPQKILKVLHSTLKKGATVHITEVQNSIFFINPYSANILKFWYEFNDFQWNIGGNPFSGANLGNLLKKAGFNNIKIVPRVVHIDQQNRKKREEFIGDFKDLIISSSKEMLEKGKIHGQLITDCLEELEKIKEDENFVYEFGFVTAVATK